MLAVDSKATCFSGTDRGYFFSVIVSEGMIIAELEKTVLWDCKTLAKQGLHNHNPIPRLHRDDIH